MGDSSLKSRQDFLRAVQNPDGGWGYFPGKRSWLEPTVYAALALRGTEEASRARNLLDSWVLRDGGWRTSDAVPEPSWASALALTLHAANRWQSAALDRTITRIVRTIGSEGSLPYQIHYRLHPEINDIDCALQGWPWRPGTTSWIEPTAHTIIGLQNMIAWLGRDTPSYLAVRKRIDVACRMLLQRRANDGGWNCGTRRVWGVDVPSYPETTAMALMALRQTAEFDAAPSVAIAQKFAYETSSPFAKAWLRIALPLYGASVPPTTAPSKPSQDVLLAAIQCLADNGSGEKLFCAGKTVAV